MYRNILEDFVEAILSVILVRTRASKLGATVVAVNPDEVNQAVLKEKFLKNRMVKNQY